MKRTYHKESDLKRGNRRTICFNKHEIAAIDNYCSKYKVDNRSKFMREAIITEVLRKFDVDYPKLFDDSPYIQVKIF